MNQQPITARLFTIFSCGRIKPMLLFCWLFCCNTGYATGVAPVTEHPSHVIPPLWAVNTSDYQFHMNVIAQITFQNTVSNDPANMVGVFVGNELRGVATPTMIGGMAYYFISVHSNVYNGELLRFKAYYAPHDKIYTSVQTETFLHYKRVGSLAAPFYIDIDPNVNFPPDLKPLLADTTLQGIPFDPVPLLNDYLISIDGDPVTWSFVPGPNLTTTFVNGVLQVTPVSPNWTGTDEVVITVQETNVPNFTKTITGKFTVLPDYGPPVWQPIPDQTIFQSETFTPIDLDNYLTFNGPCRVFDYEVFPYTGTAQAPNWVNPAPSGSAMNLIVRPLFADVVLGGAGARLAAFVNNTLVGTALPTGTFPNITYNLVLQNLAAGNITFRFYHAANQYLYEKNTTQAFIPGGTVGTVAVPYVLQLSPIVPNLAPDGTLQMNIVDPTWTGDFPIDFVVWDCRFPLLRRDVESVVYKVLEDKRPKITSPPTVMYKEKSCNTLYDATATDPVNAEGNGLIYSIFGGADAGKFSINPATGVLSWSNFEPDFENPGDVNTDNVYEVTIRVTNALMLTHELPLLITIMDNPQEQFSPQINGGATLVCFTGATVLQASGGNGYLWNTNAISSSITITQTGTYTVTVTNDVGCTGVVVVNAGNKPSATASGNNGTVCVGTPIVLQSTASGGSGTYSGFVWQGPNSFSSTMEDPTPFAAISAAGGVYTVTVTDNTGCTATASTSITVAAGTVPTVTAMNNGPVCAGSTFSLSATPAGGSGVYSQFVWGGPNNFNVSGQNPINIPAALTGAGTYTVTLTDNAGCTATGSTIVQVNPRPTITAGSNSPLCQNGMILLTSSPNGGTTPYGAFSWTGPNAFSSPQENPNAFLASPAAGGTYTVTVTDNAGCSNTASTLVSVRTLPAIVANVAGATCLGGNINLTSTPTGVNTPFTAFSWSGPNGYTAQTEDPVAFPAIAAAAGTYTVTVTDNSGCTATGTVAVSVNPTPTLTALNNGPVCSGSTLALTSSPSGGSTPYQFQWAGPDFFAPPVEDPAPFSATVASAGVYTITLTDAKGCSATATTLVEVKPKPSVAPGSNSPVCSGANINLSANPGGGSGTYTSFIWAGPSSYASMQQNPVITGATGANTGTYSVTLTDNAGCTATGSVGVAVSNLAAPSIMAFGNSPICGGQNLNLSATPTGGATPYNGFSWAGPNGYSSALQNPLSFAALANNAGVYTVTVTDKNNCVGTASVTIVVNAPSASPTTNAPICIGTQVQLTANPSGGTGVYTSYSWQGPNGYVGTGNMPATFNASAVTVGVYTVTVTDNANCIGTGTVNVSFLNNNPPSIICPTNQEVNTGANNCTGVVGNWVSFATGLSDDCTATGNITVSQMPAANTPLSGHNDEEIITLTADDQTGNQTPCTFKVILKDKTKPTISCPADVIVSANLNCDAVLGSYVLASKSDNCAATGNITEMQSPVSSTVLSGQDDFEIVTLTADDGNGNQQSCTFKVTLKNSTQPTITCPPDATVAANSNCTGVIGAYALVSKSSNCAGGNITETQSPVPSTVLSGHNDFETVTITADDGNGNTQNCSFKVTLKDNTKPTITCPADATVAASNSCTGVVGSFVLASKSDNCAASGNITETQSPVPSTVLSGHNDFETVTITADDGNGNTQNCSFKVTLKDDTKPTITCPADATVEAGNNCTGLVGAFVLASKSDNCAASGNITETQSPVSSTVLSGHNDFETVTITADDGNGNTQNCSFKVTLKDIAKPTITCPADATVAADNSCAGVVGAFVLASKSDNCAASGNITETQSPVSSTVLSGHNDFETVTITADDGNGNTQNCSFKVTLKDDTKPTITCPADATVAASNSCTAVVGAFVLASKSDNCAASGNITEIQSPVPSTVLSGHNDFETVTITADDGNGNTQNCSFKVTLKDITPPGITCPAPIQQNTAPDQCSATVTYTVTGSDNCGVTLARINGPASGQVFPKGLTVVNWTATDVAGLSTSCSFSVTIVDAQKPTITCPANFSRNTDPNLCSALASYSVSAADNCAGWSLQRTSGLASGSAFPKGANTVVWSVTDAAGLTNSCSFVLTVIDVQPPTLKCPTNIVKSADANCVSQTFYALKSQSDNCPGMTTGFLSSAPTPNMINGSFFPKGVTTVTMRATDAAGLTATCTFLVTVNDVTTPMIVCPASITRVTDANVCSAVVTYNNPTASDNCTPPPTIQRISGSASGSAFPRGITTIVWRAMDGAGLSATCSFRVTVNDAQPPSITCPPNATVNGSGTPCSYPSSSLASATATDNCGVTSLTHNAPASLPVGSRVITWTARDATNNARTCAYTVTVNCTTSPERSYARDEAGSRKDEERYEEGGMKDGVRTSFHSLIPDDSITAHHPSSLILSPNPASDRIWIDLKDYKGDAVTVSIFSDLGQLIWERLIPAVQDVQLVVSLCEAGAAAGIYTVSVRSNHGVVATRVALVK